MFRAMAIVMASYSLSLVWGGQITNTGATFRWLRTAGISPEAALMTGVAPALLNVLSFGAVSVFGLIYLLVVHKLSLILATAFATALILLLVGGVLLWWAMRHRAWLVSILQNLGAMWARLRRRSHDAGAARTTAERLFSAWDLLMAGKWRRPVGGDALSVGFDFLTLYLLFVAAGHAASPGLVLAGYGLPILAGKLSILPGGVGVIEGGMVAAYGALGVPSATLVVVVLCYRLISFWIPVLLGFAFAVYLDRQGRVPTSGT